MPNTPNTLLIAVPSDIEWRALWPEMPFVLWKAQKIGKYCDAVLTGIGKANAAAGTVAAFDPARHCGFISIGIAGSLPTSGLALGDVIAASASVLADEGIDTPTGYQTCAAMGFAQIGESDTADGHRTWVEFLAERGCSVGVVATVSTCSGTDARANAIVRQFSARAEAMEGAAVGLAAFRLGVPFVEVRVVSNTTGDRDRQVWQMQAALDRLGSVAQLVFDLPCAHDRT
ncbi:MAG: futalosine hydrolase [Phycisphaeraceae bacterium]|nr:futalosine hydrolase [Phycisphaeraceae bacterium]MCW5763703.1 futalosine hydrolase [Phycisphaeraceae bacterium]